MVSKKTIVYELNEVPIRLFSFYAEAGLNSFEYLYRLGRSFETTSQDLGHLSPWITWPTLHRGVPNTVHEISDLGQDLTHINNDVPPLWNILAKKQVSVGVFGSLHSYPLPENLSNISFYVPDTFAAGSECFPTELSSFQRFNLSMVRKSGRNVTDGIAMDSAVDFLLQAPSLGLRLGTVGSLARQLVTEKVDKNKLVRRRTSQTEISFDFFFKQLKTKQPDICFFFTNHLASAMHRYWPTIFPKDYSENKFDPSWLRTWKNEIPHAVRVANWQLKKLIEFVDSNEEYQLLVCSSMGQAAVEAVVPTYNQALITDIQSLVRYFGVEDDSWKPNLAMAPQIVLTITDHRIYSKLEELKSFRVNGHKVNCDLLKTGEVRIDLHVTNLSSLNVTDPSGNSVDPKSLGISLVDLQDAAGSNAYHIPQGVLICYSKGAVRQNESEPKWRKISTLDIAPSVLENFGVTPPSYMQGSLIPFN